MLALHFALRDPQGDPAADSQVRVHADRVHVRRRFRPGRLHLHVAPVEADRLARTELGGPLVVNLYRAGMGRRRKAHFARQPQFQQALLLVGHQHQFGRAFGHRGAVDVRTEDHVRQAGPLHDVLWQVAAQEVVRHPHVYQVTRRGIGRQQGGQQSGCGSLNGFRLAAGECGDVVLIGLAQFADRGAHGLAVRPLECGPAIFGRQQPRLDVACAAGIGPGAQRLVGRPSGRRHEQQQHRPPGPASHSAPTAVRLPGVFETGCRGCILRAALVRRRRQRA